MIFIYYHLYFYDHFIVQFMHKLGQQHQSHSLYLKWIHLKESSNPGKLHFVQIVLIYIYFESDLYLQK